MSGFAEQRRVIFISSGGALGVMTGQCALMGIPNDGVSSLDGQRSFQQNSVHDSRMKIFCGFCAKGEVFVGIRLDEKFPECVQNNENSYTQIEEVIARRIQKIDFHFYCRNSIAPSKN
jgi:hypothetical protein